MKRSLDAEKKADGVSHPSNWIAPFFAMSTARQRFPRSARLRDGREFRRLREHGRRIAGRFVVVNAAASPSGARQFGVITARSFGPAVARNHARRWLREIYRRHQHQLKPNFSIVVVARQALHRAKFSDVQAELLDLFGKTGATAPHVERGKS